jgi:hypothetical protein
LTEEGRLRVLRRIFGPESEDVTGDWKKLHNDELHLSVLFGKYRSGD